MPVPHLNIRIVQRSKGSSAVAGAAYQAGETDIYGRATKSILPPETNVRIHRKGYAGYP